MTSRLRIALLASVWLAVVPAAAYAQASITGVVTDNTGGVLPGVTVEAESPALIEGVRVAVTDGTGQYRIEALRPGLYSVTFTLPGFTTLEQEEIELRGTATATLHAELRVGVLEETITVTGEAPSVDVQSTARQIVLDREVFETLPASRTVNVMANAIVGVQRSRQDVGGNMGEGVARGSMTVRGNDDARSVQGGVGLHGSSGMSGATSTVSNIAAYEEVTVDLGGSSAEHPEGGVIINLIPRDGGNTYSGEIFANFANNSMQGDNFTQELQDRGLPAPDSVKHLSEFNPTFGGPIVRDQLWFHWSMRHMTSFNNVPVFFNKNAGDPTKFTYEPDIARGQAANENTLWDYGNLRMTWQATPKNKLAVTYDHSDVCQCPRSLTATRSPESNASSHQKVDRAVVVSQWTAPVTNRLLLEATGYRQWKNTPRPKTNPYLPAGTVGMIAAREQSNDLRYRGTASSHDTLDRVLMGSLTLSYVTGAHAFKTGFSYRSGYIERYDFALDAPLEYRLRNGVPNRISLFAEDVTIRTDMDADHGFFAQDRWTIGRLTANLGLRIDMLRISYPETTLAPTQLAPNRNITFPAEDGLRWQDFEPRTGVAFDVFGDGKTALKASLSKYVRGTYVGSGALTVVTREIAPAARRVTRTTRSWRDSNGDFIPDCDLLNPARNGECRAMRNPNFGGTQLGLNVDPDVLLGWGKRPYNWQFSVGVQRELLPRVSAEVSYWRSSWGNILATDERSVSAADFDEFSFTAPVDPRLPGGGGYVVPGLFDVKPESFGVPEDVVLTFGDNFGSQTDVWNGVDITVDARPTPGVYLQGGTSTQRQATDNCDVVTKAGPPPGSRGRLSDFNPSPLYCNVEGTFLTTVKLLGSYTIPGIDVQVSGVLQSIPGPEILADYTASNSEIRPSLGRNLAGGQRNLTVNIVEPRSMYGDRLNQLDLRIGKILNLGRTRATVSLDVYNLVNTDAVLAMSSRFSRWQQPEQILPARFAKVGVVLSF